MTYLKKEEKEVLEKEAVRIQLYEELMRHPAWLDLRKNVLEAELKKYAKIAGTTKYAKDERLAALQAINIYKKILDYPNSVLKRASEIGKILSGVSQ